MLLWPPLLTAGERFVKSTSSGRIELTTPLFYRFTLNPGKALLPNPYQRGYHCQIRQIHRSQVVGGAKGSAMVVMFVDYCVGGGQYIQYYYYRKNPMGHEFIVPARTI
jgi:hypothetical protein